MTLDRQLAISAWVMFNDAEWLRLHRRHISPEDLPRSAMRWLAAKACQLWDEDKALLKPELLSYQVENGTDFSLYGTTPEEATDFYVDVMEAFEWDDETTKARRTIATKWLRQLRVTSKLDRAQEARESGDFDEAERLMHRAQENESFRAPLNWETTQLPPQRLAIPTGLDFINNRWMGGIHLGQVGIVLAPSNTGKSMFLPYFASQALRDQKNVLYYSTELPEVDIFRRIVSALTGEPINTLDFARAKEIAVAQLRRRAMMRENADEQADLQIMFRDAGMLTVRDIEADIEHFTEQGHRPHLIILDGDDIGIAGNKKFEKIYDMYFHIYAQLSALAVTKDVAIWTAAQATREAFKKQRVEAWHVGDSIWKIRKADLCLSLNQTDKMFDEDNETPYLYTVVAKDRYYGTKGLAAKLYPRFGHGTEGVVGFDRQEDYDAPERAHA